MGVIYHRMFGGELDGVLMLTHMGFRAWEVRESVAELFHRTIPGALNYSDEGKRRRWRAAVKAGWRVVPLSVTKYTGGKPRRKRIGYRGPSAAECARNRAWDQVG